MEAARRVLIVSTDLPPGRSSGVWRITAFVKYLPQFGWEPYVLTRLPSPYDTPGSAAVGTDIPGARAVIRTAYFDVRLAGKKLALRAAGKAVPGLASGVAGQPIGRGHFSRALWALARTFVFVPDAEIGWYPWALGPGLALIRRAGITTIFSSAPPLTPHLVACRLKRVTRLPWVADFSDPWSQHPDRWLSGLEQLRKPLDRFLERRIMTRADVVVADSQPRAQGFTRLRVKSMARKLRVITNGFDPGNLCDVTRRAPTKFTITYTGTFVSGAWTPEPVFAGLRDLISEGAVSRSMVAIRMIEGYRGPSKELAQRYGLSDLVTVRVGVPHEEALREQMNSSVLLFVMRNDAGARGIYTGKLFEYLGARRPILAIGPRAGVAMDLIREANAGLVVDPRAPSELKGAVLSYYLEHARTGDVAYRGDESVVRRYEAPALAKQLAAVLDSAVSQDPRTTSFSPPCSKQRNIV